MPLLEPQEYKDDPNIEEEEDDEIQTLAWQNIIFLPFHPIFRLIVLSSVILKTTLGPIQIVFPIAYCGDTTHETTEWFLTKFSYLYLCDLIYGVDTFFHMLHRQVTDVAMSREYLPKSSFLILLDLISLIPFYRLVSSDNCPPIHWWPNILALAEFITVYRIVEYFSLTSSHNIFKIVVGFLLISAIILNFITWVFIIFTYPYINFCNNCTYYIYDWRQNVIEKINSTSPEYSTYVYEVSYVLSFFYHTLFDETNPTTIVEYFLACSLMIFGYLVVTFVVFPKAYSESLLRSRRLCEQLPRMHRIIAETKRRNPSSQAHVDVSKFYSLIREKRGGITHIPEVISELPRYLRIDIRLDLLWPVFYHSPTFRRVSMSFKRWMCDYAHLDYKLPNGNFFAGPQSRSHFFYLKSGIVQLISPEDGTTPLLSVTSGTVFGDINFFLPASSKKVIVRCLTYCEVFYITRAEILRALHHFPEDRRNILFRVKDRIKHARTLHTCKQHIRGLDRAEDEGIAWVKKRWWELNEAIAVLKKKITKGDVCCELPPEEAVYHCSKYIGRLVLCPDAQLQRKSMFASYRFPWLLLPNSTFGMVWQRIVMCTVVMVLILHPLNITRPVQPTYFRYFKSWADFIYFIDICVLLMTSVESQGQLLSNFASVMFTRCKSSSFILTLLATIWIEDVVLLLGKPELYSICQFNRLIKVFVLFCDNTTDKDIKWDPFQDVCYKIALFQISFVYVSGYFVYEIHKLVPEISHSYFFGTDRFCEPKSNNSTCTKTTKMFEIAIAWTFRFLYSDYVLESLEDFYLSVALHFIGLLILIYCTASLIAVAYLKYKDVADFLFFVSNITQHYLEYNIHPDLLKRLNKYLQCHWKFYQGTEATNPYQLKDEPYDIYWKSHGEIAVNIIKESRAFQDADPALIREIALHSKFTILPRKTTLALCGHPSKNVTWLVNGVLRKEYSDASGVVSKILNRPGAMLAFGSVFFEKESLTTAESLTECEILYVPTGEFYHILKRYPLEWSYFEACNEKFRPAYNNLMKITMKKINDNKLNEQLKVNESTLPLTNKSKTDDVNIVSWKNPESTFLEKNYHHQPSMSALLEFRPPIMRRRVGRYSPRRPARVGDFIMGTKLLIVFLKYWLAINAISVAVAIIAASLQGGSGAAYRSTFYYIGLVCDFITIVDMILKFAIGYYDERGIVVFSKWKCMSHYLSRGFILDLIGALPWHDALKTIPNVQILEDSAVVIHTLCKCARVHLLLGYFNYLANNPMANVALILVIKWQVFLILLMFSTSQYFIYKCVKFEWDINFDLVNITKRDSCWLPTFVKFNTSPTADQMNLLFGQSFILSQSALQRLGLGVFSINRDDVVLGGVLFFLGIIYWCIACFLLTILILSHRGSTLFQHAVTSLIKFLNAERLEDDLIHRSVEYFSYWWKRTKTVNIENMMIKRFGVIFRQDLNNFFLKQTFKNLDILLKGGEQIQRQLMSGIHNQFYYLPGWTIMREMDLNPWVFIVHRGTVAIMEDGKTLAHLGKGSMFGQLIGTGHRPIRVSARTVDHVDILQIPINTFHANINDEVRANILNNPQSKMDYLKIKKTVPENPYNSVRYLLRGNKSMQLPWMKKPVEAHVNPWYDRWLTLVWVVGPLVSAFIVLLISSLPLEIVYKLLWVLLLLDLIHLAHFLSEFYSLKLVVIESQCVDKHVKFRRFKELGTYVDILSLLIPLASIFTMNFNYQLARLLRIRLFYNFHRHYCQNFKTLMIPCLMNFLLICLVLHAITCGWILIACKPSALKTSYYVPQVQSIPKNASLNFGEWMDPLHRKEGCMHWASICTRSGNYTHKQQQVFLVPKRWQDDYILALTFVILHLTQTSMNNISALTLPQLYYKLVMTFVLSLLDIWVVNLAVRALYLKYRELYNYDYNVANLVEYLKHMGLSESLVKYVKEYTNLLWQKQRGNWIPELALQAPLCLREDLLGSLYSHHLDNLPLLQAMPPYFTRQLAARLQRVVVFPGRPVVQEGDIFACTYFIHEGEVEKWYTDASGERKMASLLTTNNFFGLLPGLFPNTAYQYTYITRTVVDMVFLRYKDWTDLLEGYPDIKSNLYAIAKQLKSDIFV